MILPLLFLTLAWAHAEENQPTDTRIQASSNSQRHVARQPMMAEISMAKSVVPVMAAGESKSSLTVSGEIEVPFADFPVK
jgi:hypothetical protein